MQNLTHLSLFSGIGGLDIAAEWAGFKTVGQCEWAEYPVKVLEKHWPDVPRWKDIRTLTGESFYERTGLRTVDIISGGFPCQPFSVAGKQRGKEDDRYLWPEMVRVIKELRPTWVVGENVAGIVRMALSDILFELEACGGGYDTRAFLIPACAVGARHRRYRVAIVGHAKHYGLPAAEKQRSTGEAGKRSKEKSETSCKSAGAGGSGNCETMADANCKGFQGSEQHETSDKGRGKKSPRSVGELCENVCYTTSAGLSDRPGKPPAGYRTQEQESQRPDSNVSNADNGSRIVWRDRELPTAEETGSGWSDYGERTQEHEPGQRRTAQSLLGGVADGISDWMDGDLDFIINHYWDEEPDIPRVAVGIKNRVDRLKCLGNAVVPQQFYPIFRAIAEAEESYVQTT